jgi:hypothetical protein
VRWVVLLFAGALPALACAQQAQDAATPELTSDDFAYGLDAVTTGDAAGYRAPVPLIVYQKVLRPDLADVRVFNGRGRVVPHSLERPVSVTTVQGALTPLPLFPVRGNTSKALDSVRITIESGGTRLNAQAAAGDAAASAITSYVLDGRALGAPVAAFELTWPDDAPDFAGRLRVESSEDLGNWYPVADAAPIANLRAGQTRLIERRVELAGVRAKFWRLSWNGAAAPFDILSVMAEPARDRVDVARESFAVPGRGVANKPGEFEFDLGARPPVDRVNLELPERNTIVGVALFSRAATTAPWRPVIRSGFYRLRSSDSIAEDRTNGALTIPLNTDRYWLARLDDTAGGLGDGVPSLRVGWLPHELVFLARGDAPYTLAFGSGAARATATSLRSIPSGATILRASFGEARTLGGESRLQPVVAGKGFPVKSAVLWGTLVLGVLLLGWMAYRLSRELK